MDSSPGTNYLVTMTRVARILTLVLLAVFAAGMVAHATNATVMAVEMTATDAGGMKMADCDGCGDGGDDAPGATCDVVCVAPLLATAVAGVASETAMTVPTQGGGADDVAGRTAPPEPHPPRSSILT